MDSASYDVMKDSKDFLLSLFFSAFKVLCRLNAFFYSIYAKFGIIVLSYEVLKRNYDLLEILFKKTLRRGANMKMNFHLNLSQTQKLVMTPELKQAIEILQFNALELNEFVNEELLNNPVLERSTESEDHEMFGDDFSLEKVKDTNDDKGFDWEEMINYFDEPRVPKERNAIVHEEIQYDNFVADEETLKAYLLMQLKFSKLEKPFEKLSKYIIESIDDNGYLSIDVQEAAVLFNVDIEIVEQLIRLIQTFDPPGVGARTIKECLLIQLYQQGFEDSFEEILVMDFLEELSEKRFTQIAKVLKEEPERVQAAYDFIKTLEPKPGRRFSSLRHVRYVTPDVYVEKELGNYLVRINESAVPKLQINSYYKTLLKEIEKDPTTMDYLSKNLQSALRLIKSIEQRKSTIQKVCRAIVDYQIDFFEKGLIYLKPLNLKDVADEIGVHESTVSRAVNGKYMQCPSGLFEIKYFFQSGVKNFGGDGVSAESIKAKIKAMIDEENEKKPLSDQKIADVLIKEGIDISRRTVAKYRDELFIPPSSKRKRV